MSTNSQQTAAGANATHPFLHLPIEIRNNIYEMSQLTTLKHDNLVLSFGCSPTLSATSAHMAVLHVCKQMRQDLLPFFFAERTLTLLYNGAVTTKVPESIAKLPKDILNTVSQVDMEFEVEIPQELHAQNGRRTMLVQVQLVDVLLKVTVHAGTHWVICDRGALLRYSRGVYRGVADLLSESTGKDVRPASPTALILYTTQWASLSDGSRYAKLGSLAVEVE